MRNTQKQGYDDFFRGKDLRDNPHSKDSQEHKEWERGNWDAYDDYKKEREERDH